MQIYLLRHGIAEEGQGRPDAERALTEEGRTKLRPVLEIARSAGVQPDRILTSPFKRARQTAQIAAEVLHYEEELIETDALVPSSEALSAWEEVRLHKDMGAVLLAGHEPLLSTLTGFLLGTPALSVDVKKGALIRIDVNHFGPVPRGILKWMLVPKLT